MKCEHLEWDLLVRAVDEELLGDEVRVVTVHLDECSDCRHTFESLRGFSGEIESAVNSVPVMQFTGERQTLAARLAEDEPVKIGKHAPELVMRRFGWGMAIAATLALGILVAPKQKPALEQPETRTLAAAVSNAIEVDGETFIALPYSNPDIPSSAPRIVQMQVPVSSLADIGISFETVANEVAAQDRSVLADVLLGADGQPLGVHVVSWE